MPAPPHPFPSRDDASAAALPTNPAEPAPLASVRALWGRLVVVALIAYLGLGLTLWAGQEWLLFPGRMGGDADYLARRDALRAAAGVREVRLPRDDGSELVLWHLPSDGRNAVLWLHGNGSSLDAGLHLAPLVEEADFDLVMMGYRGFPGMDGTPTERGLSDDALLAFTWLTSTLGVSSRHVVVHGRSLGGGVAGTLIGRVDPGGWVFESTFDSAVRMAQDQYPMYPARALLRHPFDTFKRAPSVAAPVLQLHSRSDEVVPFARGASLAERWPEGRATFVAVEGIPHNRPMLRHDVDARVAYTGFLESVAQR